MAIRNQHAIALILCGLVAFGHAPAWLHIAGCGHDCHVASTTIKSDGGLDNKVISASQVAVDEVCAHGCCHHSGSESNLSQNAVAQLIDGQSLDGQLGRHHHHHDSESCTICQSVAVPAGVTWTLVLVVQCDDIVDSSDVVNSRAPESSFVRIRQPRGPPTLDA